MVWWEEGVFCVECFSPASPPLLSTAYQCDGCLNYWSVVLIYLRAWNSTYFGLLTLIYQCGGKEEHYMWRV